MATTYTENLHLGMQEDKTDKFNFSLFTENWGKIDTAFAENDDDDSQEPQEGSGGQ